MRKSPLFVAVLITMIMTASLVTAQTPEGVEPGVWAKVEGQLEAQGAEPHSKAGRDVPVEVAKLLPTPDMIAEDARFGRAIAVDGDLMVVGAYDHFQGEYAGASFIFQRDEGGAEAWGQVARLQASDGAEDDFFGFAVSISGDTVVVGAPFDDENGPDSGSAYIFERNQGGSDAWGQVAKLTVSDGENDDQFGYSVSVSGDTVVVGVRYDDDNGSGSGSAYNFGRNEGGVDTWGQMAKLTASDGAAGDQFGISVSISGDTIIVGAYLDDDNGENSGSAYIFDRDQGGADAWGQVAKLTASDGAEDDYFGNAVSISGDTVVVGAYRDDDNGVDSGSAYIFGRNQGGTGAWGQVAKLMASDGLWEGQFGRSVSISGDTVIVGISMDFVRGQAYIFGRDEGGVGTWGQLAILMASDGAEDDYFGSAVSISGDTVVVGAHGDDDHDSDSGSAYIFGRNQDGPDTWGQVTKQAAPGWLSAQGDRFGFSVSASGDTMVVGANEDDDNGTDSGAAYIFVRDQGGADTWGLVVKITASDGAFDDYFGNSVSISGDTVVVGAYEDDDNGSRSGSAYIFERDLGGADAWGQAAKITAADGNSSDCFGYAVSISGSTVVVGAYQDDDNGSKSGSAYIFGRNHGGLDAWGQVTKLTASEGMQYDEFGYSVAIGGNTVVVGAHFDDYFGTSSGSAYIFGQNQGGTDAWGEVAKIRASDNAAHDYFGDSVSISGDSIVIGAYGDDDNGSYSGSACVFGRNYGGADAWGQVAKIVALDGASYDHFGNSVSINDDIVVVGAYESDASGYLSGSAYLFGRNQGGPETWGQMAKMTPSDGASYDGFGYSISLSGDTVVAGVPWDEDIGDDSGSAYVFDLGNAIFIDGFETGDTTWWSATQP